MNDVEQLLRTYGPAMRRLAASYVRPGAGRDDLEQEIWMAIAQGMAGFRQEASVRTYIYRIAHHCALRAIAKQTVALTEPFDHEPASDAPSPEAAYLERERHEQLARGLRALPLVWRQPLMMRLEGMSYQEIADALAIELHNVTARIYRGTSALKALMERGEQ